MADFSSFFQRRRCSYLCARYYVREAKRRSQGLCRLYSGTGGLISALFHFYQTFPKPLIKAIAKYSENSKVFVLVHKMDLLNEENAQEPGIKEKKFAAKKAELEEIASKFSIKVRFTDFQGLSIKF